MKIAFFWTWEFSRNILDWILKKWDIEVWLVVSQPDKPIWRKKIITPTPIKLLAEEKNIKVLQPEKLKDNTEFFSQLKWFDFLVVVAYWKIVPKEVLDAPKYGCINIHWSILPLYRWASPIQESIKNWDNETWLTIMYMSEWMDTWDILKIEKFKIYRDDKTQDIFNKFEKIGPNLLISTLEWIIEWNIKWQKQDNSRSSNCSKIYKEDWKINIEKEFIVDIYNKYKAYTPWPGIFSYYNEKKFSIEKCDFNEIDLSNDNEFNLWEVIELENEHWDKNKQIWIICKWWILILKQVKLEWKKSMDILSFINWNKEFLEYKF
jgi:methionyl-tRNA formyltransferase